MRGERIEPISSPSLSPGSSPHARGTLHALRHIRQVRRFIPACAGNAPTRPPARRGSTVHPRMRGERFCAGMVYLEEGGSSPHARGTLILSEINTHRQRFIPACAGNAVLDPRHAARPPVHPRMRGEREAYAALDLEQCGSSPHARGTPWRRRIAQLFARFIPACAGNACAKVRANSV